jgi:DNA-binding response OmpR family regulator
MLASMDVQLQLLNTSVLDCLASNNTEGLDLLILDANHESLTDLEKIEDILFTDANASMLLIVQPEALGTMKLPRRLKYDFIVRQALDIEYQVRIHQLLWPGEEAGTSDFIRSGTLTLNLATYQVKVDGTTLDLTYLEYALLAFLITHPGRTYSRDALLRRVWGFDYYGGSRTVDVHVRRVRSKLGPELAQRLETVRGVGYLWNS